MARTMRSSSSSATLGAPVTMKKSHASTNASALTQSTSQRAQTSSIAAPTSISASPSATTPCRSAYAA